MSQKKRANTVIAVTIHYNRYLNVIWFSKVFGRKNSYVCTFSVHDLDLKNSEYTNTIFTLYRTDKNQNLLVERSLFS